MYGRISRKELNSFLRQFDYPDANVHAAGRVVTTTPMQKLYLLNSPFVAERAARLAAHVGDSTVEEGVSLIFRRVLSRLPDEQERVRSLLLSGRLRPGGSGLGRLRPGGRAATRFSIVINSLPPGPNRRRMLAAWLEGQA